MHFYVEDLKPAQNFDLAKILADVVSKGANAHQNFVQYQLYEQEELVKALHTWRASGDTDDLWDLGFTHKLSLNGKDYLVFYDGEGVGDATTAVSGLVYELLPVYPTVLQELGVTIVEAGQYYGPKQQILYV